MPNEDGASAVNVGGDNHRDALGRRVLIGCTACGAVWYSDRDPLCECDEFDKNWETP